MLHLSTEFFEHTPMSHVVIDKNGKITDANPATEKILGHSRLDLIDQALIDFVYESDRSQFYAWLQHDPLLLSQLVVRFIKPNHRWIYIQLQARKIHEQIIISLTLLSSEFIQPQKADEQSTLELFPETDVRYKLDTSEMQELVVTNALHNSMLAIVRSLELDDVLDEILENIRLVIAYDVADIMLIDEKTAYVAHSRGYKARNMEQVITSLRFPIDTTPSLREMYYEKKSIIIDDMRDNEEWVEHPQQEWMRAYAGIPIQMGNDVLGFLNLVSSNSGTFFEEHLTWLEAFAIQAAIAINNAQIRKRTRKIVLAEERQRMAREIHDTVSQMLFSSSMIAESLATDNQFTDATIQNQLRHIFRLNRGALAEMRMLLMEYKPENLVKAELPLLLERLKQAVEGRTEIEVDIEIDNGHPAPPETRLALYRIAQEALNNVSKHATATHARIRFISTKKDVVLEITDGGVGFDPDTLNGGDGLHNMRARAESIGATLTLNSIIGEGTSIRVHWLRDSDT